MDKKVFSHIIIIGKSFSVSSHVERFNRFDVAKLQPNCLILQAVN